MRREADSPADGQTERQAGRQAGTRHLQRREPAGGVRARIRRGMGLSSAVGNDEEKKQALEELEEEDGDGGKRTDGCSPPTSDQSIGHRSGDPRRRTRLMASRTDMRRSSSIHVPHSYRPAVATPALPHIPQQMRIRDRGNEQRCYWRDCGCISEYNAPGK